MGLPEDLERKYAKILCDAYGIDDSESEPDESLDPNSISGVLLRVVNETLDRAAAMILALKSSPPEGN